MDPIDRSDDSMSENPGTHDDPFAARERTAVPPGRSGGIFRGITRHWWRILFLWLVISSALAYGIYRFVEPTYQAFGMIKVESNPPDLYGPSMNPFGNDSQPYLLTEIESIRSNPVLDRALQTIADYPMVKNSKDPKSDLRGKLILQVLPNTHWIKIAIESTAPNEACDIVNAVIKSYDDTVLNETLGTPSANKKTTKKKLATKIAWNFKEYRDDLGERINETKNKLRVLARKDDADAAKAQQENKSDPGAVKPQDVKKWHSRVDEMEATFLRDDLERYYPMYDLINRKLEQLEFTRDKAEIEIERIDDAELPRLPTSNKRLSYMALQPVAVLISLLGLFLVFGRDRPRRETV